MLTGNQEAFADSGTSWWDMGSSLLPRWRNVHLHRWVFNESRPEMTVELMVREVLSFAI